MKKNIKFYELSVPFSLGIFFGIIASLISIFVPLVVKSVIDINHSFTGKINYSLLLSIFILMIISAAISSISSYLISISGDKLIADTRVKIQSHLIKLPLKFFNDKLSGQLNSRIINDTQIIKTFMTTSIPSLINSLIIIVGTFTILFLLDWKLSTIILFSFSLVIIIAIPLGKINEKLSIKTQEKISQLSGQSTENLQNIKSIKLNNAENDVIKKFQERTNELYHIAKSSDKILAVTIPIQTVFTLSVILSIILYGGFRVQEHSLTMGTLVSFLIYLFQIMSPINSLANFYTSYTQTRGSTSQLNKILNVNSENTYKNFKDVPSELSKEQLSLQHVTFGYDSKNIITDLNMSFKSGSKVAIVGPSGSGKSTIINLLTRLYKIDSGLLLLGNSDSKLYDINSWRNLFGVVTQENTIVSGSIYYNLTFGLKNMPTPNDIWEALDVANIKKEIENLPMKLDTLIGEKGVNLSGGQRQRLQIARAYLKKSPFLILDEATSSLDSDSEKQVADALNKLSSKKTIISIAHRLSTVTDSDRIYFVNKGRIVGCGTHQELLTKIDLYRKFVEEQMIPL